MHCTGTNKEKKMPVSIVCNDKYLSTNLFSLTLYYITIFVTNKPNICTITQNQLSEQLTLSRG